MRNLFKDHILVAVELCCNADDCQVIFVYCVCRSEWTTSVTQHACTVLHKTQPGVAIPCVILFPASTTTWEENNKGNRKDSLIPVHSKWMIAASVRSRQTLTMPNIAWRKFLWDFASLQLWDFATKLWSWDIWSGPSTYSFQYPLMPL